MVCLAATQKIATHAAHLLSWLGELHVKTGYASTLLTGSKILFINIITCSYTRNSVRRKQYCELLSVANHISMSLWIDDTNHLEDLCLKITKDRVVKSLISAECQLMIIEVLHGHTKPLGHKSQRIFPKFTFHGK